MAVRASSDELLVRDRSLLLVGGGEPPLEGGDEPLLLLGLGDPLGLGGLVLLVGLSLLRGGEVLPDRSLVMGVGVAGWLSKHLVNSAIIIFVRKFITHFIFVKLTIRNMQLSAVLVELAWLSEAWSEV